jgi:hypothetical protein
MPAASFPFTRATAPSTKDTLAGKVRLIPWFWHSGVRFAFSKLTSPKSPLGDTAIFELPLVDLFLVQCEWRGCLVVGLS